MINVCAASFNIATSKVYFNFNVHADIKAAVNVWLTGKHS